MGLQGVAALGMNMLQRVVHALESTPYKYEISPSLGGIRPALLVHGPQGQTVAVDLKLWRASGESGSTLRAANYAAHLKRLTDADHGIVLLPGLLRNYPSKGVIAPESLQDVLKDLFEHPPESAAGSLAERTSKRRSIFAAMPFAPQYDDTYLVAMTEAASAIDADCVRTDKYAFEGDVVDELKQQIKASLAVIADMSELKPNVFFELGYAHGLKKIIVPISSTPLDVLPFDVRNWNVIEYRIGQTIALKAKLTKRLNSALKA
jgi:hypothetical protein